MRFFVILPALALAACAQLKAERGRAARVTEGMVERVTPPPLPSGIIPAWAIVAIRTRSGAVVEAHVRYLSQGTPLPLPGTECAMTWHAAGIDGFTANGSVDPDQRHRVADSLDCIGRRFDYAAG